MLSSFNTLNRSVSKYYGCPFYVSHSTLLGDDNNSPKYTIRYTSMTDTLQISTTSYRYSLSLQVSVYQWDFLRKTFT